MQIDKSRTDAQWCKVEGTKVELLVRPFPFGAGKAFANDDDGLSKSLWHQYDYSLQDWKGIENGDGGDFEFNDENKRFIFDFVGDIRNAVYELSREVALKITDAVKN